MTANDERLNAVLDDLQRSRTAARDQLARQLAADIFEEVDALGVAQPAAVTFDATVEDADGDALYLPRPSVLDSRFDPVDDAALDDVLWDVRCSPPALQLADIAGRQLHTELTLWVFPESGTVVEFGAPLGRASRQQAARALRELTGLGMRTCYRIVDDFRFDLAPDPEAAAIVVGAYSTGMPTPQAVAVLGSALTGSRWADLSAGKLMVHVDVDGRLHFATAPVTSGTIAVRGPLGRVGTPSVDLDGVTSPLEIARRVHTTIRSLFDGTPLARWGELDGRRVLVDVDDSIGRTRDVLPFEMLPFAPAEALATSGRDHVTVSPYLDDEPESTYRAWLLPAGFDSWSVDEAADLVTRRLGGR